MNNETKDTISSVFNKFEYDDALEIMQNYGYSSASQHPYIYQNGDDLGICYSYVDYDYGTLERIKLFESAKELEDYLKQMNWLETNGSKYNIRMALDNYETVYPRILFLRNDKIMVPSEMADIDNYDNNLSKRANLDDTTKILYEAGDLLLVYDELKARQLAYIQNLVVLKNALRQKYYDLQVEVDKYNRIGKIERHLNLLPEATDFGIDISLEIAIKDRYNQYIAQKPSFEDAVALIRDTWDMCKNLEQNNIYYEVQIEDNNIRNEMKNVEAKLAYIKELNDDVKPLFGADLVTRFRKINKDFSNKSNSISTDYINNQLSFVEKKYGVFDQLEIFDISEYLKETISNSNIDDLVRKYAKGRIKDNKEVIRLPLNEVVSNLTIQFKEKLSQHEQAMLVLHNNTRFKKLFDSLLAIPNYDSIPIKKVIKNIKRISGFSKIKSECFDMLKKRLEDPINANIKASLFSSFDFSTFEKYISSIIKLLESLNDISNKLTLNSNINMYCVLDKPEDIKENKYLTITNDINGMYMEAHTSSKKIALIVLEDGTPVLYSPYTFDFGDLYSKNANQQMFIKETIGIDLMINNDFVDVQLDDMSINVVNYQSEKEISQNLTTAISLNSIYKTTFYKASIRNKEVKENTRVETVPVEVPIVQAPIAEVKTEKQIDSPKEINSKEIVEEKTIVNENKEISSKVVDKDVPTEEQIVQPIINNENEVQQTSQMVEAKQTIKNDNNLPSVKKEEKTKIDKKELSQIPKDDISIKSEINKQGDQNTVKTVIKKAEIKVDQQSTDKKLEQQEKVVQPVSSNKPVQQVNNKVEETTNQQVAQTKPVQQTKVEPSTQPNKPVQQEIKKVEEKSNQQVVQTKPVQQVKVEQSTQQNKPVQQEIKKVEETTNQQVVQTKPVQQTKVEPSTQPNKPVQQEIKKVEEKPNQQVVQTKPVQQVKVEQSTQPNKPVQQVNKVETKEKEEVKNEGNN